MKSLFSLILLATIILATIIHAQPASESEVVAHITTDLFSLRSVLTSDEALEEKVYRHDELSSLVTYGLNKIMQSYQRDLIHFQLEYEHGLKDLGAPPARNRGSFVTPDHAYKLMMALANKELSEKTLTPLAEAIVQMMESAIYCANTALPLENSALFRSSAEKLAETLKALGVAEVDRRIVVDAFFRDAKAAASPVQRTLP